MMAMTEWSKTGLLLGLAAAAVLGAVMASPRTMTPETMVTDAGERFFPQFDPLDATSLEIATVDEESGEPKLFKVAKENGVWIIPSHDSYPADAKDRLAKVAASVVDVTKGSPASDSPGDQELYGVIDPSGPGDATAGFGTRIKLDNEAGGTLVNLIIGKEVKESPGIRYVRVPGRDRIYMAAVDTADLSSRFEDWIERDLLQLEAKQVAEVVFDDYSIDELNQRLIRGDRMVIRQDDKMQWIMEGVDVTKEGLQNPKLNDMRRALDDLRIVDVRRKPAGLSAQLQTQADMTLDSEARGSLASRGFFVVGNQLLSNEGETIVRTKEGVEYILRFGEIASFDEGVQGVDSENSSGGSQPGRYLFVTAAFRSELIPEPEYESLPEPSPAPDDAPSLELPAEAPVDPTSDAEGAPGGPRLRQDQPSEAPMQAADDLQSDYDEECQRITAENDRKRAEYEQKIGAGEKKVQDLNRRFAAWYYIVDDKEYARIRLKRSEIVTPLDAKADNTKQKANEPAAPPVLTPPEN
jgi:hypothetical protein